MQTVRKNKDGSKKEGSAGLAAPHKHEIMNVSHLRPVARKVSIRIQGLGILPTLMALVINPREESMPAVRARLLADGGAQQSICSLALAQQLRLQINPTDVTVGTIGGNTCQVVGWAEICVISACMDFRLNMQVLIIAEAVGAAQTAPSHPFDRYPSMKLLNAPLAETWPLPKQIGFEVLVGQDYLWAVMKGPVHFPEEADSERGPCFTETRFGLVVQGYIPHERAQNSPLGANTVSLKIPKEIKVNEIAKEPALEFLLKRLWSLEAMGIKRPTDDTLSATELEAQQLLERDIKFLPKEKRFQVCLPFNSRSPPLMNHPYAAMQRWLGLEKHLQKDPVKAKLYHEGIKKYIAEGHAAEVTAADEQAELKFTIPHSGVMSEKADGTKKLRIVYDLSFAGKNGQSLNNKMMTGKTPAANLARIICQFRQHKFAFTGDVRDCFLNIALHPSQHNLFRFYYRAPHEQKIKLFKFCSLLFGGKASSWVASYCMFKLLDLHEETDPEVVCAGKRGMWLDDFAGSMKSVEEAKDFIKKLQQILAKGSFKMAKFAASDPRVLEDLKEEQCLTKRTERKKGKIEILGITYDIHKDTLSVGRDLEAGFERKKGYDTKRTVARAVASVFDICQILLPWKTGGMILLRDIWTRNQQQAEKRNISKVSKCLWDEPLEPDLQQRADEWRKDYKLAAEISIARCLVREGEIKDQEIWGFGDSSLESYAAVIYLRTTYTQGPPTCVFLLSRGRINPPQKLTLPRGELLAAKLLAEMSVSVREYLGLPDAKVFLFSDSTITLSWIKSPDPDRYKSFVANQIRVIHNLTSRDDWHYVNTKFNAADCGTRPHSLRELKDLTLWHQGPEFMWKGKVPSQPEFFTKDEDAKEMELKVAPDEALLSAGALGIADAKEKGIVERLLEKHSDFLKVLRIIAWVKRAFRKERLNGELVFEDRRELFEAMMLVVKEIQAESFSNQIKQIKLGKTLRADDQLSSFAPFLDETGVLRSKGRMPAGAEQNFSYDWLYPALLPSSSAMLEAMILYLHESMGHAGVDTLQNIMSEHFWVLKFRVTLRKYILRCLRCRKVDAKALQPKMAPLPLARLQPHEGGFHSVSCDGLGPVYTKGRGGEREKNWVLLFTCPTTRAVHLELMENQDASCFIHAMRRFIGCHGLPARVHLDRYSSHQRMSKEFKALFGEKTAEQLRESFKNQGIKWIFSPVEAPHCNGLAEREVQTAKHTMMKALGNKLLTREELRTFLAEAKALMNSKPLAQCLHQSPESSRAISPNMLIYGKNLTALPLARDLRLDQRKSISAIWEDRQRCIKQFKTLFIDQYLSQLRRIKKWSADADNVAEGDMVMLPHHTLRRKQWPLGVVVQVRPHPEDGVVRSVRVRTASGVEERSVRNLIWLKKLGAVDESSKNEQKAEPQKAKASGRHAGNSHGGTAATK
jgi:hypothetical protein